MRELPSRKELDAAFAKAEEIHREYLAVHEVKMPSRETHPAIWIAMLFHYLGEWVHKDVISDAVLRERPGAGRDQQVRHLKEAKFGWNLESRRGEHRIVDPYRPSETFITAKARRDGRLSAKTFEDIKRRSGYRCATCGAAEGRPHRHYQTNNAELVKLQQGHRNPRERANDPANIIAQCQYCNRSMKDDFVFDDKGRPRAIASIRPVARASLKVKRDVQLYLEESLGEKRPARKGKSHELKARAKMKPDAAD